MLFVPSPGVGIWGALGGGYRNSLSVCFLGDFDGLISDSLTV